MPMFEWRPLLFLPAFWRLGLSLLLLDLHISLRYSTSVFKVVFLSPSLHSIRLKSISALLIDVPRPIEHNRRTHFHMIAHEFHTTATRKMMRLALESDGVPESGVHLCLCLATLIHSSSSSSPHSIPITSSRASSTSRPARSPEEKTLKNTSNTDVHCCSLPLHFVRQWFTDTLIRGAVAD